MKALLAALLMTAACGAKLPVSRPSAKASENGLWTICYDKEGKAELHETRDEPHTCGNPSQVKWPSLPVKVHLNGDFSVDVALHTFSVWEDWMGTPVFVLSADSGDDVVELTKVGLDDAKVMNFYGIAAIAPHTKRMNGTLQFVVLVQPDYEKEDVLAHELGHVLGLSHDHGDVNKRSIMYPSASWYLPHLSGYDRALLRHLYGIRS